LLESKGFIHYLYFLVAWKFYGVLPPRASPMLPQAARRKPNAETYKAIPRRHQA
jgi:hypothetical protein